MYRSAFEYLREWKNRPTRKPLVIRGARQVGKSYLVRQFADTEFDTFFEINLENDKEVLPYFEKQSPGEILQLLSVHFDKAIKGGSTLLFLDEVQAAPQLLAKLRYFHEKLPDVYVIAAGSLLEFVLEDHVFSMPVGRIEYLHLGPLTFMEFLGATGHREAAEFLRDFKMEKEFPLPLHNKLSDIFKQYLVIGGMPESVNEFAGSGSYRETDRIKQSLFATYVDDFSKYGKRINREVLDAVFRALPAITGHMVKYSRISRDFRPNEISRALHLLSLARVCYPVYHSACNGIPLSAEIDRKKMKPLFLDVGLLTGACGLSMASIERASDILFVNSGSITEQFIGQHLLYREEPYREPELHFWTREKPSSNAEIDFAVSRGTRIVGIEVKAGTTGSLKSLNQFMLEKKHRIAVRFNLDRPSLCRSAGRMPSGDPYDFSLLSLPCYAVEQMGRLLDEVV